jgi:hypothetical protein
MKPDWRTTALPQDRTAVASSARGLRARVAAWWRQHQARRDERAQIKALALLGPRLLQDIGMRDGVRAHTRALRDARYERMARWIAR